MKKNYILVFLLVCCILLSGCGDKQKSGDVLIDDAIVIQNKNITDKKQYGIFNQNGNLLALSYEQAKFYNNASIIVNENGQYGLIGSNGKMIVEYGKYKKITVSSCLFVAQTESGSKYLIDSQGKVLYDLQDKEVKISYVVPRVIIITGDGLFDVLNYKGESIIKLNKKVLYELTDSNGGDYALLKTSDTTFVINKEKGILVNTIKTDKNYCINSSDFYNQGYYVLIECGSSFNNFEIYKNDKLLYTKSSEECSNVFAEGPKVLCAKKNSNERFVLDEKGNDVLETYLSDNLVINTNTYVKQSLKNTIFYVNNKEVKTVECFKPYTIADYDDKVYILKGVCNSNNGIFMYYDQNGKLVYDQEYKYADGFDKNGLASVSVDRKTYYIINKKGEKVSMDFDKTYGSFFGTNQVNTSYLVIKDKVYYILDTMGKEIYHSDSLIYRYDNYFIIGENGKDVYYSMKGKKLEF